MKKSLIVFFFSTLALFSLCFVVGKKVEAAEVTEAGKVVFHYQLWDKDYSSAGLWTWNTGTGGTQAPVTSTVEDEFGGVYEISVMSDAGDTIGLIPIRKEIDNDNRWNYRETPDGYHIEFDVTPLKNGDVDELHVYYFQGGYQTYHVLDKTKVNIIVIYYDPTGGYESNLGVHAWGGWENFDESGWGTPAKIFKDGFKSPGNVQGKSALLQFTSDGTKDPGFLIYAGDDATKKSGDIKGFKDYEAGSLKVFYVSGQQIYDGVEKMGDFADAAFSFGFIPFNKSDLGGTFAKTPTVVFVKTTIAIATKEKTGTEEYQVEEKVGEKVVVTPSEDGWKLPTDLPTFKAYTPTALPEGIKGKVVFHYQKWDGDYQGTGLWTWGNGTGGSSNAVVMNGVDGFGAVMEIMVAEDADDEIGIIPLGKNIDNDSRWDSRETADGQEIKFNVTSIKDGSATEIHVYYLQGSDNNYFVADSTKANILLVYYEQTGSYDENLGVHGWNLTNPTDIAWGTPAKIFKDFNSPVNVKGKVGLLQFEPGKTANPGLLIYAGDDASKKTGNIEEDTLPGFNAMDAGDVRVVYTTVGQLYDKRVDFAPVAFGGTVSIEDIYGMVTKERDVISQIDISPYFILKQGDTVIEIDQIDYNRNADSTNEFVIQLAEANKLDASKEYKLYFNNNKEDEENLSDEIILDLDKEKPVINLVDPDAVINVELGSKWDHTLFPIYRVTDDRDDNLSTRVYVVEGKGTLNTNKVGTYPITLQVEDEWGNVGELTFNINVIQKKGCGSKSASIFVGAGLLGLVFLFRRRRVA